MDDRVKALEADLDTARRTADLALAEIRVAEQRWAKLYLGLGEHLRVEIAALKGDLIAANDRVWVLTFLLVCVVLAAASMAWLSSRGMWRKAWLSSKEGHERGAEGIRSKLVGEDFSSRSTGESCSQGGVKAHAMLSIPKAVAVQTGPKAARSSSAASSGTRASELSSRSALTGEKEVEGGKHHGRVKISHHREHGMINGEAKISPAAAATAIRVKGKEKAKQRSALVMRFPICFLLSFVVILFILAL